MIRVLVLIAVTGFFVGVVALSAAGALGGPELAARGFRWSAVDWWDRDWDHGDWSDRHGRDRDWSDKDGGLGAEATREMAWDGSTRLEVDIPAEVEFIQAAGRGSVVITGPKEIIDKVTLSGGTLNLDHHGYGPRRRLQVRITAPNVSRFEVNGNDRLDIRDFRQDRLIVDAGGSAEVTARGVAKSVMMDLSGSVEADLSQLSVDEAYVDLSGSGEATIAPKVSAHLDVSGSGEIVMLTRPPQMTSDIGGSGEVTFREGGEATAPAPAPDAPAKSL